MQSAIRPIVRLSAVFLLFLLGKLGLERQRGRLELGKEYPPDDEQFHVERAIRIIKAKTRKDYQGGRILRGPHPKSNGLVRAEFTIESGLQDDLRVGLFKEPKTYNAWVRFSNAVDQINPDSAEDFRGFAIKLFDVPGEKLLDDEENTHDFVFFAHEAFHLANVEQFSDFFEHIAAGRKPIRFFLTRPRNLLNPIIGEKTYPSPLEIRWFSVAPFLYGDRAVKYCINPLQSGSRLPKNPSDDYLFDTMKSQLANGDANFDFMVQFQTDANKMPIENLLIPWKESQSPFRKVASIRIPAQTFGSPEQNEFDENMTFNPWHCIPEHRPLGGLNRARRDVMKALSDFRLKQNEIVKKEPTGQERF
ncbi:MAG: catalase family protein [Chloroflexi bacterium]|nr:catalase family protein [Chloroflexota bacterium]